MVSSLKPGTVDVHGTVGHEIIQSPETRPDIISSAYCLPVMSLPSSQRSNVNAKSAHQEFNVHMEDLRRRSRKKEIEYHRMLANQSADNARLERRQRQIRQMCEQYFEMKAKKSERSGEVDAAKGYRQPNRQLVSPAETAQLLSTDCPSDSIDFVIPPNKRRKPSSNQPGSSSEISNGAPDAVTSAGASAENATGKPEQPIANESELKYDLSDFNLASSFVSDLNLPADVIEDVCQSFPGDFDSILTADFLNDDDDYSFAGINCQDLNQPKALDNTGVVNDGGTTGGVFQQQNAYNDGNNILKKDAVNSSTRLNSTACQPAMVRYPYSGGSNSFEYNPPTVRAPFFLPNDPAFFDHAPPNVSYVPSPEKHPPPPPSMINSGQTTSHHPMVMGNISLPMNMQQLVRQGALPMSTGVVRGATHYENEYLPPPTPVAHHVAHHHHLHHHHHHQPQPQQQQQQQQQHHHHQMGAGFRQNAMPIGARYSSVVDPYAQCGASSSQMQPMPQMGGAPPPNPVGMPMQATQYGGSYPTALSGQMNAAMFSGQYQQPVVRNPNMGYPVHQQVQYDSYRQPRDVGARFYQMYR
ncbi:hypothetical protein T4E_1455 [Trichinella pseudospiralis]|uniref:Uncharacterized protein n=1 Tax=Trichinella pseudospiralis TaxID=6337 RepID=A0A0V0Y1D8_TRIPS|nr:hypothetical protein T4E_1455 [Trichinella pseudospiralis]